MSSDIKRVFANSLGEPIKLSTEPIVTDSMSWSSASRDTSFKATIRERDGRCVVTGVPNLRPDIDWYSWQAAHIFPKHCEKIWNDKNFDQYITDMDGFRGSSKINSVQNGLLLRSHIHTVFATGQSVRPEGRTRTDYEL